MHVESTQQTIALDDGATTTLESWGAHGPVMLCVHGMTSSRKAWTRFAQRYADRYRVIAYDQRGHGDSAGVAGPMSLERGVRDAQNVAAAAGADILIGHSWGGAVVIRAGARTAAQAVVAIDPMLVQADDQWYDEFLADLAEQLGVQGAAREERLRADYAQWPAQDVEGKIHAMRAMTAAPIEALRDENREGWDLLSDIAAYPKPLLLAMADPQESIVPPDVMEAVRAHHGPDVRIVTFAGQGHNLHRTDFEGFATEVDEFLPERLNE